MKIILGIILAIGIYIFLDSYVKSRLVKEGFAVPYDRYLNNQISQSLDNSIDTLNNLNIIKPVNTDSIYTKIKSAHDSKSKTIDDIYSVGKAKHDADINAISDTVTGMLHDSNIIIPTSNSIVNSIKSLQNSQPLNLTNLSNSNNETYLVNVNGQCLETNSLAKTRVRACNEDNPNQHFKLEFINDNTSYENSINTIGQKYSVSTSKFSYPFNILKSISNGNCLNNNNGLVSVIPCQPSISQQWSTSFDPIKCTYEQV
jgi:hypothetical protein